MRRMITAAVAGLATVAAATALSACTSSGKPSRSAVSSAASTSEATGAPSGTSPATATSSPAGPGPVASTPSDSAALVTYVRGGLPAAAAQYRAGAAESGQPMRPTPGSDEFTTPSGNISCGIAGSAQVLCSVTQYSYPAPPRPANCHLNYGPGWLSLGASGVTRGLCLGGPPFPPVSSALPYGSTLTDGPIACRSEQAFLACADTGTGHGFVVDRDDLRTY